MTSEPNVQGNWVLEFGINNYFESYRCVAVDSSDNIFVVGGVAGGDTFVARINPLGTVLWKRVITGSAASDYHKGVALLPGGNVVILVSTPSTETANIISLDADGAIRWQRSLTGPGVVGKDVYADAGGNIFVSGYYTSITNSNGFVAKYNSSGTIQWQNYFAGFGTEWCNTVNSDESGNLYVVGYLNSNDLFVCKMDGAGNVTWQRKLYGGELKEAFAALVDADGNVYVVGYYGNPVYKLMLVKYDSSGVIQWQSYLQYGTGRINVRSAVLSGSSIYIASSTYNGTAWDGAMISKVDTTGTFQWHRKLSKASPTVHIVGESLQLGRSAKLVYAAQTYDGSQWNLALAKVPVDGTGTGTYGAWTYTSASPTSNGTTLSEAAAGLTVSSLGLTDSAGSLTISSSSMSTTFTNM
jgi:hypothetical protein